MIRTLIGTSLRYRYLVITLVAVLMIAGVRQIATMPVDPLPEFSPPYVEIQTEALGLSAAEVEQMITVPMEQDLLAGVAWLDVIRSKSIPGLSSVVIYFEPGTDLYRARQMVAERLAQAAVGIPHVSKPPAMVQPTSSASRFMIVGLSSEELSPIEMSVLARWVIGPRLLGVPGVANVAIWGNRDQQLQVLVDPERLQKAGVTLDQIVETTGNALWVSPLTYLEASTPGTGGFIDTPNQRLGIWHVLPISSPDDLAKVPVAESDLTLGQVTQIVEDHQPLIGDAIKNNSPGLLLVIEKLPGTNTLNVTEGVESAIAALRPGFSSIDFDATLYRPATFIEVALANLRQSLIIAAVLVTLVFGLFLYNWRALLISVITIPVSLIAALYFVYLRGDTLNTMVLAGLVIALGIVIDDAVVDVEYILNRLGKNMRGENQVPVKQIILEASARMRGTLLFATLLLALAILPVFTLSGVTGALYQPLAVSYLLAVLAAMVVALTLTPVLSLLLFSGINKSSLESPIAIWLRSGYERLLARIVNLPLLAYAMIAVLVGLGLASIPSLRQDRLLPPLREPFVTVGLEASPGTSQPEMNRIVSRMSEELRTIHGVQNVAAHVGRAVLGDQTVGVNSAELWIGINSYSDYDETMAAIQDTVYGYPGLAYSVGTYLDQALSRQITNNRGLYTLRVYGEDQKALKTEVEKIQKTVAGVDGVADAKAVYPLEEPVVEIEVDIAAAQRLGVKPGDVRRAAAALLSGIQVGSLFEEQKVFDVVVWGEPATRRNLSDIQNLLIDTPDGGHVRLGDVAAVQVSPAPTVINREAISPYLDVVFRIRGQDPSTVLANVETAMRSYPFPLEYHVELQQDYLAQEKTQQGLSIAGVLVLIGVLLILQAAVRSWQMAFAVFLTVPAALAGCLLAVFLNGGTFYSISAFGLFAVLGIFIRNAIVLIKTYHTVEDEGMPFSPMQVVFGSSERLSPQLMTFLATGLALVPLIFPVNLPGHEVTGQLSLVIIGGLITSSMINLFIMPALYLQFGAVREEEPVFSPVPPTPEIAKL